MAEEVHLLRLVKAFTKIRSPQTRREIVDFVEAALEFEETCSSQQQAPIIRPLPDRNGLERIIPMRNSVDCEMARKGCRDCEDRMRGK